MPAKQSATASVDLSRFFRGWRIAVLLFVAFIGPAWHLHVIN